MNLSSEDLFELAEDFTEWIKNMSIKYDTDTDDIQEIIKQFLK